MSSPLLRYARAGVVLLLLTPAAAFAQGRISGTVARANGEGVGGVLVVVEETGAADVSDGNGRYQLGPLDPGRYLLHLSVGAYEATEPVDVGRETVSVSTTIDWPLTYAETVTVTGVSKHVERVLDAPASATVFTAEDISAHAADAQLPRLFASAHGVELTQSSLFSYSLNVRGFNSLNSRHLPMFIDGRDPSTPVVLGNQEWGTFPVPMDEVESIELVRGPAATLYGAGAFNGVVNVITKPPRSTPGGMLRLTTGEMHTAGISGRQAGAMNDTWSFRVSGAYQRSRDFTRSRVTSVEYAGLDREVVPVPDGPVQTSSGAIRFDRNGEATITTIEGGTSNARGVTSVTSAGRSYASSVQRPWARVNVNWAAGWNLHSSYSGRMADDLKGLNSGASVYLREHNLLTELQHHRLAARGRAQIVAGAAYRRQAADSADPDRQQTVFTEAHTADQGALFGQADWRLTDRVKAVIGARFEASTLHAARVSPRAALVWSPRPEHTFRVNYSDAFQSPSLVEFFLSVPVAAPIDLSPLERALVPITGGVDLGLSRVPVLAVGNRHMVVDRVHAIEAGYSGVLGRRLWLTADYFHDELRDFATNLLPQIGTSLGRVNSDYAAYAPPAALSPAAAAAVTATLRSALPPELFAALSNDERGRPLFAVLSFTNYGSGRADGLDLAATYWLRPEWRIESSYSFFSSRVRRAATESPIEANTPAHQVRAGVQYAGPRVTASAQWRWVDAFHWSSGVFSGPVPAYGVLDAAAGRRVVGRWRIQIDAANLLDNDHYEVFGGAVLKRRIVGSAVYAW